MKRDKAPKSGIATKKVLDLLDFHMELLTRPNRRFYRLRDEGYYLDSAINPRNTQDYVKIGYTLDKKFLSRTFNLEFKTVFHDVNFPEDFNLKIKFTGFPGIQAAYFKGKKGEPERYERLYNDARLLSLLEKSAKIVDIGYMMVSYSKAARKITIAVAPYAGALLWLVFPPLFFKMPLKQHELEALWEAMIALRRHTSKLLEGKG